MKKLLFSLAALLIFSTSVYAQGPRHAQPMESGYDGAMFTVGADLQSRYIWRGLPLGGSSPSIQPAAAFHYKGLELGAWAAYSVSDPNFRELDFHASYTFLDGMMTAIFTDYSFPSDAVKYNWFKYDDSHTGEVGLKFNGTPKCPLSLAVYCNVLGIDAKKDNGDDVFSSYAEADYRIDCPKLGARFNLFAGAALNSGEHQSYYGNNDFEVINAGASCTKVLPITDRFALPVTASIIFNPQQEKANFVIGTRIAL